MEIDSGFLYKQYSNIFIFYHMFVLLMQDQPQRYSVAAGSYNSKVSSILMLMCGAGHFSYNTNPS